MNRAARLLVIVLGCSSITLAQDLKLSAATVDCGGGFSSGPTIGAYSSSGYLAPDKSSGGGGNYFFTSTGFVVVAQSYSGGVERVATDVDEGWNLLSVPALVADYRKSVLFPTTSSPAYVYHGGYEQRDTLRSGEGFWLKHDLDTTVEFLGVTIVRETLSVGRNWNIIGTTSFPVPASRIQALDSTILVPGVYGYSSTTGYFAEDTLVPGKAYWIKVQHEGRIVLNGSGSIMAPYSQPVVRGAAPPSGEPDTDERFSRLEITDAAGRHRTLYFSAVPAAIDLDRYELPPPAPGDILDVRYATNRRLATAECCRTLEIPVRISSGRFPVSVSWDVVPEEGNAVILVGGSEIPISGSGSVRVASDETPVKLRFQGAAKGLPEVYDLKQNYPNPFNPTTEIGYAMPAGGRVSLRVYDLLGREVAQLVDEEQEAGTYSVSWDASQLASGIYTCRMTAGQFTMTRRMVLAK